jgi:saccharopine dehydrogenase (NAD+, L-lysine forming)
MSHSQKKGIWLRAETKKYERRTPLTPSHASQLIQNGIDVVVESSTNRTYQDGDYEDAGCQLVTDKDWREAPIDYYILGIKELPNSHEPISHEHIYFAHAYKHQEGADKLLSRFVEGGGVVYDYEYLTDCLSHPVVTSSFSYWSGFCGAAISLLAWDARQKNKVPSFDIPMFFENKHKLIEQVKRLHKTWKVQPASLVIGAAVNAGKGVCDLLNHFGLDVERWSRKETALPEQFVKILDYDMLFNCIRLTENIMPFLTLDSLTDNKKLSIVADISCDPSSADNPLPIYFKETSFSHPTRRVQCESIVPVDVMAIDHLASFLPKESSDTFSAQLFPFLCELLCFGSGLKNSVWNSSLNQFHMASCHMRSKFRNNVGSS